MVKCTKTRKLIYPTASKPIMMKGTQHDNLETVQKKSEDDYPPSIAPRDKFRGEDTPDLPRHLPLFASRPTMVLTLDNGPEGDSTGWIWDQDENRFVEYHIPVEDIPIYKCSYCQKSFRGSGTLSTHLKSHNLGGTAAFPKFKNREPNEVTAIPTETIKKPVYLGNTADMTNKSFLNSDNDNGSVNVQSESHEIDNDNAEKHQQVDATSNPKRIPGCTSAVKWGTVSSAKTANKIASNSNRSKIFPKEDELERIPRKRKVKRRPTIRKGKSVTGALTGDPEPRSPVAIPKANEKSPDHLSQELNNDDKLNKTDNVVAISSEPDATGKLQTGMDNSKIGKLPAKISNARGERKKRIPRNTGTGNKRHCKPNGSTSVTNQGHGMDIPGITENIEVIPANDKEKRKFKCRLCDKVFSSKSSRPNAIRHIKIVHLGEKHHQCPHCPQAFSLKQILKHHMYSHTGYKPFRCDLCPAGFFQKGHLTLHLRIHSGIKAFKCNLCEKAYYQRFELTKHQRSHEEMSDAAMLT